MQYVSIVSKVRADVYADIGYGSLLKVDVSRKQIGYRHQIRIGDQDLFCEHLREKQEFQKKW